MKSYILLGVTVLFFLSCSGSGDKSDLVNQGPIRATGTIKYERVNSDATGALNYDDIVAMPSRGVKIQLVLVNGDEVISNTSTDDSGKFTLRGVGDGEAYIRVYASLFDYPISVQDNTAGEVTFVAESSPFTLQTDALTKNLLLPSGWDSATDSYASERSSAPFAILDTVYSEVKLFRDYDPTIAFPQLKINWSENNSPNEGTYASGEIGTSHWNDETRQLYILGQEDVDTDEFDHHVIAHEWGHYFEDRLGRADTFGGDHSDGDVLDTRVAFSEGFCNALSAIALYPDAVYRDSGGNNQQSSLVVMDIESGDYSNNPGWFSEISVHQIVYDLWDQDDDGADSLSLGIGPIYDSLMVMKDSTAVTNIFSFIHNLSGDFSTASLNSLLAQYSIDPITDNYGSGETNFGNWAYNLPVYEQLIKGGSSVSLRLQGSSNGLASNRLIRFTPTSTSTRLIVDSSPTVTMEIYHKGEMVGSPIEINGHQDFNVSIEQTGQEHIISLYGNSSSIHNIEVEFP